MTGHAILQIVKGIQKTPGDNLSAEVGLDSINLLDTNGGFAVDTYEMKIPALKSGAVYADSPITNGRTLISGALGNVNETIRVTLHAGTTIQLSAMLSKLLQFKQDCNDYWDTTYQVEPVYIKHQVNGEPGMRYALLYDIDIAIESPINPSEPTRDLTIVIEREHGWRGIAPGENPRKWTLGANFDVNNASLVGELGNDPDLITATINNRTEYNTSSKQSYLTKNFVDIPAGDVPGDLPALLELYISDQGGATPTSTTQKIFISRFSPKATALNTAFTGFSQALSFNAADCTLGTNTTVAADTGAPVQQSSGTARRGVFTPADNNAALRFRVIDRNTNNHRGRFRVFVRARQHSGATGDLSMWIQAGAAASGYNDLVTLPAVTPTRQDGTGNTTYWPVADMGIISLPASSPVALSINGTGASGDDDDLEVRLYVQRLAGTTAILYVSDIVLIPISEPSGQSSCPGATDTNTVHFLDSTGYFMHGRTDFFQGTNDIFPGEYTGQDLSLLPGVDQRLYFFTMFTDSTSKVEWPLIIRGNIVPRWAGLRDV